MAKSSLTLKLRPNPTFIRHFSSFSDIKSTLQNPPRQQINNNKDDNNVQPVSVSLDRIKKDLGEFRLRSAPPTDTPPVKPVLFQELYKRHVVSKETNSSSEMNTDGKHSFSAIRDSLRQLSINTPKTTADRLSLGKFKDSLSLRPIDQRNPAFVFGSPQKVPVLSKKMREEEGDTSSTMKTAFVKMYSYKALGEKLRKLRPEGKLEGGFTLQELNERLLKLREMEERENESGIGNPTFKDLRESLVKMQSTDKKQTMQRLDLLNHFGPTPSYMLDPPKEHLVEKYFHPDNMSSAEKLKIELQKVRDEFKMSESDCGSARVQVAQLTTKIKHLATALHPKDKHSRKGLQGMIQQRKKLLKYLRRTDWDSYTLVLSKLSLRDNPDYKN